MASACPRCHETIEFDAVCCAGLTYGWKCKSCGKLTQGFVVPYGRCYLCGGEIEVVKGHDAADPELAQVVEQAAQVELDMYQFYRLALARTQDEQLRAVLESLFDKEEEHLRELEEKYHLHFEPHVRELAPDAEAKIEGWLFEGISFADDDHVLAVYDKAIELERRTRDHFRALAEAMPPGTSREVYRELAAEEDEHVALLETERAQFERS